ncbi:unnamed protein product [Arctia plantaginis]|uniref:Uncharacterized protein n=1 Tax=Arctia plantaginis TaxID=874455 RepID=A0A8S1B3G0_ARCPL|nr:unnamed protein product [Arctia plantaginis]
MSLLRSPEGSKSTSVSRYGSSPDLRKLDAMPSINITHRKRKQPENEYLTQFEDFRSEIMTFFKEFAKTQQETYSKLQKEITEIKYEQNSESIIIQQNALKQELTDMQIMNNTYQQESHNLKPRPLD